MKDIIERPNMNKPKPTPKPRVRKPKGEPVNFDELMRRIVRVNPQDIKLPKRWIFSENCFIFNLTLSENYHTLCMTVQRNLSRFDYVPIGNV